MIRRSVIGWVLLAWWLSVGDASAQTADPERSATSSTVSADDADEPGAIDRWRDRYEQLKRKGISFTLGSILPGSYLAAGVELRRNRLFGTPIGGSVGAAWSVRGYRVYDVRLGLMRGYENRTELRPVDTDLASSFNDRSLLAFGTSLFVHMRHRVYPRVDFFGLGPGTSLSGRSDFKISGPTVDVVAQWQRRHVGLAGRFGHLALSLGEPTNQDVPDIQTLYTAETLPGLDRQHHYRVLGVGTTLDYRDKPHLTAAGTFLGLAVWRTTPIDRGADHVPSWTRLVADVRQFVPTGKAGQTVALRLLLSTLVGHTTRPTPFYLEPTLGGSKSLRGFGSYRLRGDAVWGANVEYRWLVIPRLELVPFVDAGAVAARFGSLDDAQIEVTPGIGVRGVAGERVVIRLDFAHGRDGTRAIFAVSAPF